ncbi:MAG: hypothetical protein IM591_08965 [Chitinophagaceae bacterium]|nr:hypothetical protein [Chitinophagaceae bacterium]
MIKKEDYAFPVVVNENTNYFHGGLSKREYFAAMAMQGLLANGNYITNYKFLGEESVMFANALIEALNNTDNPSLQP